MRFERPEGLDGLDEPCYFVLPLNSYAPRSQAAPKARDAVVVDGYFLLCDARVDRRTASLQVSVDGADKLRGGIARVCLPCSLLVVGESSIGHAVPLPPRRRRGVVVQVAVERLRESLGWRDEKGLRGIVGP